MPIPRQSGSVAGRQIPFPNRRIVRERREKKRFAFSDYITPPMIARADAVDELVPFTGVRSVIGLPVLKIAAVELSLTFSSDLRRLRELAQVGLQQGTSHAGLAERRVLHGVAASASCIADIARRQLSRRQHQQQRRNDHFEPSRMMRRSVPVFAWSCSSDLALPTFANNSAARFASPCLRYNAAS